MRRREGLLIVIGIGAKPPGTDQGRTSTAETPEP